MFNLSPALRCGSTETAPLVTTSALRIDGGSAAGHHLGAADRRRQRGGSPPRRGGSTEAARRVTTSALWDDGGSAAGRHLGAAGHHLGAAGRRRQRRGSPPRRCGSTEAPPRVTASALWVTISARRVATGAPRTNDCIVNYLHCSNHFI